MEATYATGTPGLKAQYRERTGTNAAGFIGFDDDCLSLFALIDGRSVGLVGAKKRALPEPLQAMQEVSIDIIGAQPRYQRQGIGTALLDRLIAWATDNQAAQLRAWSEEIRTEALLLWRKLGFTFSPVDFRRGDEQGRCGFYAAKRLWLCQAISRGAPLPSPPTPGRSPLPLAVAVPIPGCRPLTFPSIRAIVYST